MYAARTSNPTWDQYEILEVGLKLIDTYAEGQEVVYFSVITVTGMEFLAELTFKAGVNACKICLKTENVSYGALAKMALENILRHD